MEKKTVVKIIGVVSLVLIAGGTMWYLNDKKKKQELADANKAKDEEDAKKIAEQAKAPHLEPSYPSTGFNQEQGDNFRAWMNGLYPKTSQNLSLDKKGAPDNNFIRKAYVLKGDEYKKYIYNKFQKSADADFRKKYLGGLFA